jgi:hypothetical protein
VPARLSPIGDRQKVFSNQALGEGAAAQASPPGDRANPQNYLQVLD